MSWRQEIRLSFVSVTGYFINKTHNYPDICEIQQIPLSLFKVFGKNGTFFILDFVYLPAVGL